MRPVRNRPIARAERLAYWYFRLNGFLTTENFIVHPDTGGDQRTDADVLAVRFAHRAENLVRPMDDDPRVTECGTYLNVVIAEVKTGRCALNGPWTDPEAGNMERVLKAIGCVPDEVTQDACENLHARGAWTGDDLTIRLFALGESRDESLPIPVGQQLIWTEVIDFCVGRFENYRQEKSSLGQWTPDGRLLREVSLREGSEGHIRSAFNLTPAHQARQA